jgi:hypothetical protein
MNRSPLTSSSLPNHPKVCIVISSQLFKRNYLNDLFLDSPSTNTTILAHSSVQFDDQEYSLYDIHTYELSWLQQALSSFLFKSNLFRFIGKSKTFRFRLSRYFYVPEILNSVGDALESKQLYSIKTFFKVYRLVFKSFLFLLSCPFFLAVGLLPSSLRRKLILLTGSLLIEKIRHIKPDLVIFPFAAYEAEQNYLALFAKQIGYKSFFCTDNWDNLSSKNVVEFHPDFISVWGRQTAAHAITIHNIKKSSITRAPSPRLAVYNTKRFQPTPIPDGITIGFVGSFLPFDEIEALSLISDELEQYSSSSGTPIRILYRPHPWRMASSSNLISALRYVQICPELQSSWRHNSWSIHNQPALLGYRLFFDSCSFIVGGLTTMLLEALLSRKIAIAIAYWDKPYNLYSPASAYKHYTHFKNINKLSNLRLAESKEQLINQIRLAITDHIYRDDKQLSFFVEPDRALSLHFILDIVRRKSPA